MPDRPFPAGLCALYRSGAMLDRARALLRIKRRYETLHPEAREGADRQSPSLPGNSSLTIPQLELSAAATKGENPSLCSGNARPPVASSIAGRKGELSRTARPDAGDQGRIPAWLKTTPMPRRLAAPTEST